ncbi:cytochrome c biogenesis CcdA family protein [Bradyrhizobium sediminis]|uniref:cytochrome c biogenesis CcdA family protein n=1 Tax=Bradyrhizobium sediminis TaxID=2840469 RepID=UPI00352D236E
MPEIGNLALSYAAGALSTLSPCVLPLLPIVLFGVLERHAWGPVALAAGLATSFAVLGTTIASVGFNIGLDPATLRSAIAMLMLAMGVVLLIPALQGRLAAFAAPVATGGQTLLDRIQPSGLGGQFVLGGLLGAIWSPCSGPTLGAAIGLAAQGDTVIKAAAVMALFGLGAATPILALAYGSRQAILTRRDLLAKTSRIAKPVMGVAFAFVGAFVLTGIDKIVETSLTNAMPDWLTALTTRL